MPGEREQSGVEHDGAGLRVVIGHERTRVIEEHLLGHAAEGEERALEPVEPALLAFVAERPHVDPARVAERGDEQEDLDLAPADLDEPLAEVDLQLAAWRRLEADGGPRLREKLLAIGRERALHGPQARDGALLAGELLTHDVAIAAIPAEAFAQPVLQAVKPLPALQPLERLPAAGVEVPLHRPPAHAQLARDPLRAPAQPLEPQHRRHRLRLDHLFPPRLLSPRRGSPESAPNSVIHHWKPPSSSAPRRGQVFVASGGQFFMSPDTEHWLGSADVSRPIGCGSSWG